MSRDIVIPLSASLPVYAEASQIYSTPSVQPIRLSQVREDIPEPVRTSDIDPGDKLSRSNPEPSKPVKVTQPEYKWLSFTATFYVKDGPGMNGKGITATGTKAKEGRTIAVDPKVIPYGTWVYIEGWGYRIAEDCGGFRGKHIDIFMNSIRDIPRAGKIKVKLRILKGPPPTQNK